MNCCSRDTHISPRNYITCGIMSENDDGESFSDISCTSTEKNSITVPAAKKSRRELHVTVYEGEG